MRKTMIVLLSASMLMMSAAAAQATNLPRLMIVGEDADRDAIPADSQVFDRVLKAASNRLIESGFDVRDMTALTLDTHRQHNDRRSDAELIQVARDVGVDVLVMLTLYPRVKSSAGATRLKVRATGRLLSVNDGARLGNFEAEPMKYQIVEYPPNRDNVLAAAGQISKVIGYEVADVLTQKLESYESGAASGSAGGPGFGGRIVEWTLVFDNFDMNEMMQIEEYLVQFSGYQGHRPKSTGMNTSRHHEYWYRSNIHEWKMKQNLHRLLKKLGLNGKIQISGNQVEVAGVRQVKQRTNKGSDGW